jgi:hypothetical protein
MCRVLSALVAGDRLLLQLAAAKRAKTSAKRNATYAAKRQQVVEQLAVQAEEAERWDSVQVLALQDAGGKRCSARVKAASTAASLLAAIPPQKWMQSTNILTPHASTCGHYKTAGSFVGCDCRPEETGFKHRFHLQYNARPSFEEMTVSIELLPVACNAGAGYAPPDGHDMPPQSLDSPSVVRGCSSNTDPSLSTPQNSLHLSPASP